MHSVSQLVRQGGHIASLTSIINQHPWSEFRNSGVAQRTAALARAVTSGILDAPQLQNNPYGLGQVRTRTIAGQCLAVDTRGQPIHEKERLGMVIS